MQFRVVQFLTIAVTTACVESQQPVDPPGDDSDVFEFEPGMFVPLTAASKADLPNRDFQARQIDTSGYRTIANKFVTDGRDVTPTGVPVSYDWPLAMSRMVLNRQGTPIKLGNQVYEHTGLDIIRHTDQEDAVVHAPTSGTAVMTDWAGNAPSDEYSTVISIWDPSTHLIVQLMHVKPDPLLPRTGYFEVQRGQVLGELATISIAGGRHTHVNVIDAQRFELIDPVTVFPSYPDTKPPFVHELYLLDATAKRHDVLQTGPMDVVVTAHDRDDMSPRNLEVESIAFTAKDQLGKEIGRLERCDLSDAYEVLARDWSEYASTIRLIDFGNATGQFSGFWPGSDLGNPDRLFRYAITNLRIDQGRCTIVANDRDGQLEISPDMTKLTIVIELWDARDNRYTKELTLERRVDPPPPV